MAPTPRSAALVYGFATALGMWTLGFVARMPAGLLPGALILAGMLAVLGLGGRAAARASGGGFGVGAATGLVASIVNLLILGSLISGDQPNRVAPSAAIWLPASLAFGALVAGVGGFLGRRAGASERPREATSVLARVAAAATLMLLLIGGLVTSHDAGLAVVDWPNSYRYQMFLFPLAKMTGGIYWEHSHRLFGSLVGLTTVVLALRVWIKERGAGVKAAAAFAVLLVVGQGILGGLRVTGHFTWSDSPDETNPSLVLAMIHGTTGQIFFAWMVGLAAALSRTWRDAERVPGGGPDRALTATLVTVLLCQLLLGVRLRHLGAGAMIHITVGTLAAAIATIVAVRLLGSFDHIPVLRKTGGALMGHVWTQIVLGGIAYLAVNLRIAGEPAGPFEVAAATAHQTVGALLLANAVLAWLWTRRLLSTTAARPAPSGQPVAS
ncbi:MAG: COX15/CtaA family protein [bacterium]